jgi:branched-chain amino acid aminotransferase
MEVVGKRLTRDEVCIADEASFTGTSSEVLPMSELDGRTIGSGKRDPVTEKLQSMYFDQLLARREENPEWSTTIN